MASDTKIKLMWIMLSPLLVGAVVGLAAGLFGVVSGRLLGLTLSNTQEKIMFFGFVGIFSCFGLIDSANRIAKWARKKEQLDA